ncbi:hypothetical protein FOA52_015232 [Chlamydomonas sp. UWO 241]|nr:hypothetical protein FOA52_015232 [Chlamydomonas sp. UWO 241]
MNEENEDGSGRPEVADRKYAWSGHHTLSRVMALPYMDFAAAVEQTKLGNHARFFNIIVAVHATEESAQAEAAARRATADADGAREDVAWDVNTFMLTEAVAPGDVVFCVEDVDMEGGWWSLSDAAVHVDKAQAQALLVRVKAEVHMADAKLRAVTVV